MRRSRSGSFRGPLRPSCAGGKHFGVNLSISRQADGLRSANTPGLAANGSESVIVKKASAEVHALEQLLRSAAGELREMDNIERHRRDALRSPTVEIPRAASPSGS